MQRFARSGGGGGIHSQKTYGYRFAEEEVVKKGKKASSRLSIKACTFFSLFQLVALVPHIPDTGHREYREHGVPASSEQAGPVALV